MDRTHESRNPNNLLSPNNRYNNDHLPRLPKTVSQPTRILLQNLQSQSPHRGRNETMALRLQLDGRYRYRHRTRPPQMANVRRMANEETTSIVFAGTERVIADVQHYTSALWWGDWTFSLLGCGDGTRRWVGGGEYDCLRLNYGTTGVSWFYH